MSEQTELPTLYQQFIHLSKYARWRDEDNRRETWNETVGRYWNFMMDQTEKVAPSCDHVWEEIQQATGIEPEDIQDAIRLLLVMPSMRAMMTAGSALARDNTAGYNCSYLPIDTPIAFDELMYILLCGTGVGYSVERRYVGQLPTIADKFRHSEIEIVVEDSKEGWGYSTRQLISLLYAGQIPGVRYHKVREKGARLKTFGGRASGPEPLKRLHSFLIDLFVMAQGRKLTTFEVHLICCFIADIVVVGGVRRSAMIALSDIDDEEMAKCKSGEWWVKHPQLALANISWVDNGDTTAEQFAVEWGRLVASKSGERGIFSRAAAERQAKKSGVRKLGFEWGTNPCSEIVLRPYQFCNLTEVVVRSTDTLEDLKRKVAYATVLGTIQATLTDFPYLRDIWRENTEDERLLGVSLTGIMDHPVLSDGGDEFAYGLERPEAAIWLDELRRHARRVNERVAAILGINVSAAITCVKPSGTVSQLVDSASGIHARHAQHYIRTARGDNKDPLTQFMIAEGVPHEPCVMKPEDTTVFSFPIVAPWDAICRNDRTAVEQLNHWMMVQEFWCEHKPSVTISVGADEWMEVGAWVWDNLDKVSGISFLPRDDHTYQQAPYQDCTLEEVDALSRKMPKELDWSKLYIYETEDHTEGTQILACAAGGCEIV